MATHAPITGAPTCAPSIDRRSLLAVGAIVPALATLPALAAAQPTPFSTAYAKMMTLRERVNHLPAGITPTEADAIGNAYTDALTVVDTTPVANWAEFVQALETAWEEDGDPFLDLKEKLLADARRLLGRR